MARAKKKKNERAPTRSSHADHLKALKFYNREIGAIDPEHLRSVPFSSIHPLYFNRAIAHLALKNYNAALSDADSCISLRPDWAKGYLCRGQALESLLRLDEARQAFETGLALDSTDSELIKGLERLASAHPVAPRTQPTAPSPAERNDRFSALTSWLARGGAYFPKLEIHQSQEGYRSVHSVEGIIPGDVLLFVPLDYIITRELAMTSELGKEIIASKLAVRSTHTYLASYLLEERSKGRDSFWHDYIETLPRRFDAVPLFFSAQTLGLLKGSFALNKLKSRSDNLKQEYENLTTRISAYSRFTYEDFVWARVAVVTRIFGLTIHGRKTDGMVPYADMLNHKKHNELFEKDTNWGFDDRLNGFKIIASRAIAQNKEVFDNYGRKCNSRFLINYGFVLRNNDDDNEARFRITMRPHHPCFRTKLQLLKENVDRTELIREFDVTAEYEKANHSETRALAMFSFLRYAYATETEFNLIKNRPEFNIKSISAISSRNEHEVLECVKTIAETALSEFETTLEIDRAIIASNQYELHSNEFNCIIMRMGEKQVFTQYIYLADTCIPLLEKSWKDFKRATAKNIHGTSPHDYYITSVLTPLVKAHNA